MRTFSYLASPKQKVKFKYRIQLGILTASFIFPLFVNTTIKVASFTLGLRLPRTEDWIYYAYQKKEDYGRYIKDRRKIVIISGSNSLFGLSAEQIEQKLSLPTINYAVHAGLGIDFLLYKSRKIINDGDIVILPLENIHYFKSRKEFLEENLLLNYTLSYEPNYLNQIPIWESSVVFLRPDFNPFSYFNELRIGNLSKSSVKKKIIERQKKEKCYSAFLNINGDELCNKNIKFKRENLAGIEPPPNWQNTRLDPDSSISDFVKHCKSRNIKIIPLYQVGLKSGRSLSPKSLEFYNKIKQFWLSQGVNFIDTPYKSLLEEKYILDTKSHPTDEGRRKRTRWVIDLIKNEI